MDKELKRRLRESGVLNEHYPLRDYKNAARWGKLPESWAEILLMEPGPEMDAKVAEALGLEPRAYSTDMGAAWLAWEQAGGGTIDGSPAGGYEVGEYISGHIDESLCGGKYGELEWLSIPVVRAPTALLAICQAVLMAHAMGKLGGAS